MVERPDDHQISSQLSCRTERGTVYQRLAKRAGAVAPAETGESPRCRQDPRLPVMFTACGDPAAVTFDVVIQAPPSWCLRQGARPDRHPGGRLIEIGDQRCERNRRLVHGRPVRRRGRGAGQRRQRPCTTSKSTTATAKERNIRHCRYLPGWWPTDGDVVLFDIGKVAVTATSTEATGSRHHGHEQPTPPPDQRHEPAESRMRGNTHVRFGGAGRGNGPSETTTPRPGPIPTSRG